MGAFRCCGLSELIRPSRRFAHAWDLEEIVSDVGIFDGSEDVPVVHGDCWDLGAAMNVLDAVVEVVKRHVLDVLTAVFLGAHPFNLAGFGVNDVVLVGFDVFHDEAHEVSPGVMTLRYTDTQRQGQGVRGRC